jgi:hypothetical protein
MGKAVAKAIDTVLNPSTGFFAKMIHDVGHEGGKLLGITQAQQRKHDDYKTASHASYKKYDPDAIEKFARMGSILTGVSAEELEAAKPVAMSMDEQLANPQSAASLRAKYANMTKEQSKRIEGLYKGSMGRLEEIKRGQQRPGARKQSLITRKY